MPVPAENIVLTTSISLFTATEAHAQFYFGAMMWGRQTAGTDCAAATSVANCLKDGPMAVELLEQWPRKNRKTGSKSPFKGRIARV